MDIKSNMKILHITNWYPSRPTPLSALWIQNHIKALSDHAINKIYHIEIRKGSFKFLVGKNEDSSSYILLHIPIEIWRLYEIISFLFVMTVLVRNNRREYEVINFHIAYPNCTYLNLLKKFLKKPLVITEHWSAYHYDFNIEKPGKRRRIQNIFQYNIPVISVSKSLLEDVKKFSNTSLTGYIIPNIVNTDIFRYYKNPEISRKGIFFAVSQWKWPKDPFILLKAWKDLQDVNDSIFLIIGGYGPQWKDMVELADKLGLSDTIEFRGKMNQKQIALEMNRATAFIHISEYETFSVVCAEALCCGTPVIASKVGGIMELINSRNGILVENNEHSIIKAIQDIINNKMRYNRMKISESATCLYNRRTIGKKYFDAIQDIIQIQ
jgi:glycosyltransferase involved in cell wall biosynthesis